jgi:hypothetical protein
LGFHRRRRAATWSTRGSDKDAYPAELDGLVAAVPAFRRRQGHASEESGGFLDKIFPGRIRMAKEFSRPGDEKARKSVKGSL